MSKNEERQFYTTYYQAVAHSRANESFCTQLFGKNMAQHGFAEVSHIDHLIQVCQITKSMHVLDLGCGSGLISEYISDQTGAKITGIDFIPGAIKEAKIRTWDKRKKLRFKVMNMGKVNFPPATFDVILSVDTLYFVKLSDFLPKLIPMLKAGGQLGAFYSQTWEPWTPIEAFDLSTVHPDRSGLATILKAMGLSYTTWDYTLQDIDHARRKLAISKSLREQFEAEGNQFLYDNHVNEAEGIQKAFAANAHGRWLYRVVLPGS